MKEVSKSAIWESKRFRTITWVWMGFLLAVFLIGVVDACLVDQHLLPKGLGSDLRFAVVMLLSLTWMTIAFVERRQAKRMKQ